MSTTPETKLVSNAGLVAQVTQPLVRTELVARSGEGSPTAPGQDSLDERLQEEMSNRWGDFMARAEASLGEAPLPSGSSPVKKASLSAELVKTGDATESKLPASPAPAPSEPAPAPRPQSQAGRSNSQTQAQEAPKPTPAVREERPSVRPVEGGSAGRPEEARHEVARDRSQLEARAAETEQQARDLSARESVVHQVREIAQAKRAEAAQLRSRVAERRADLNMLDLEFGELVKAPGAYLERFEEVERMQLLRYQMQQEIAQDEQAALSSEQEAQRYASLAAEHESHLSHERLGVERRREAILQDRAAIERKALDAERAAGLLDHSNPMSSSLQFWSTLAREGELDRAAFEARRLQEQLDRRDEQAAFRIDRNLEAARNGNFSADLSGHGLNEGTRAEVALYQLQRRMEKLY
ncbi:MAG: hypothetical protein AMXMBFR33_48040 [Candidatus Xenobia bacterium]